ncbi:MAG: TetR/AcrR family transcriptional regulator [Deltaproteobacteria bacterium]|nr:TetR/AcrR family transcriptional regulator [Deltaproteobacteria bacterium]
MENRDRIIAEALGLFSQRGYAAVGVQEIAAAAGVTKPTLYHYFGSKRGLLREILEERFLALLGRVRPAAAYSGDLPLTLYRLAQAYFSFARENEEFYRWQLAMWFAPPQSETFLEVTPWNRRQQEMLEELFLAAARDHGNMKGRHQRYAATFLGMVNTLAGLALQGFTRLDDTLVFQVVHQFMHGIYS